MNLSRNVLVVTNAATEEEIQQIKEAVSTQQDLDIHLNLVHVIPSLPTCYFNIPSTVLLAERYYEEAEKCLESAGNALGVEKQDQWLITGRIKTEVLRLANKLKSDFILAGSVSISELHEAIGLKKSTNPTPIQSMSNLASLAI